MFMSDLTHTLHSFFFLVTLEINLTLHTKKILIQKKIKIKSFFHLKMNDINEHEP